MVYPLVLYIKMSHVRTVERGINMNDENWSLVSTAITKGQIDEGMEQILNLIRNYNVNNEEWLNDAMYHLAFHSMVDPKGEEE
tara:strand:- start:292 stop:540 length:249 start_codon:yes stop_codon:yes gene_type:complete